jgi:hypothetical protein
LSSNVEPGCDVWYEFINKMQGNVTGEEKVLQLVRKHGFESLAQARQLIKAWRVKYNQQRPHSSLGYLPPENGREDISMNTYSKTRTYANQIKSNTIKLGQKETSLF